MLIKNILHQYYVCFVFNVIKRLVICNAKTFFININMNKKCPQTDLIT